MHRLWILIVVIVSLLSGLIYVAVQQTIRLSANDPQIQMSEDLATKLTEGLSPQNIVPFEKVNIATSLAPFIIIYDQLGNILISTASLDGLPPKLPKGVFDDVRIHKESRLTWQPKEAVRGAIVVTRYDGAQSGYVLVGRSLREVKKLEDKILLLVGIGWITTVTIVTVLLKL